MINAFNIKKNPAKTGGFSLLEMLTVIAIFLIFTAILIPRSARFHDGVLLTNLAYDVAITIRNTRAQALGVREVNSGDENFDAGYGVRFSLDNPSQYFRFADNGGDSIYGGLTPDEQVSEFSFNDRYEISDLCISTEASTECASEPTSDIAALDIVYRRPAQSATITAVDNNGIPLGVGGTPRYTRADIIVTSQTSATTTITVYRTGQIAVDAE